MARARPKWGDQYNISGKKLTLSKKDRAMIVKFLDTRFDVGGLIDDVETVLEIFLWVNEIREKRPATPKQLEVSRRALLKEIDSLRAKLAGDLGGWRLPLQVHFGFNKTSEKSKDLLDPSALAENLTKLGSALRILDSEICSSARFAGQSKYALAEGIAIHLWLRANRPSPELFKNDFSQIYLYILKRSFQIVESEPKYLSRYFNRGL